MAKDSHKNDLSAKMREMYDAAAGNYVHWVVDPGSYNMLAEIPYVYQLIGNVMSRRVLDLCCGAGPHAIHMAREGADVVGVDYSKKLIEMARRDAGRARLTIDFRLGDATDLSGFEDASFDAAVAISAVHYIKDVRDLFSQIRRILKRDGWFIFSTGHPIREAGGEIDDHQGRLGRTVFNYFQHDATESFTWPDVVREDGQPFTTIAYSRTIQDYVDALADTGFLVERVLEPPPIESARTKHPEAYRKLICCPQFVIFKAVPK
jgi:SAM-dependent methyltransferase